MGLKAETKPKGCLDNSVFVKNPILFMIMLDIVSFIITIIGAAHLKGSTKEPDVYQSPVLLQQYKNNFTMGIILVGIELIRLVTMVIAELARMRYFSIVKSVKINIQVMIFIGRFIFNLIIVVPYFFVCTSKGLMSGLGLYLPAIVLTFEELPGVFLALYLFCHKDRSDLKSETNYN